LDRLKAELEGVENKVANFKQLHANSLPEHLDMHMGMLQRADSGIKELEREYKSTQEELRYLDVELTSAKSSAKASTAEVTAISELDKAKAELERSLVIYKETHPTIRALKRKVETLEKASVGPAEPKVNTTDIATDLVVAKIQAQIEAAKVRLNSLAEQKRGMQAKMGQLQAQVSQSPQVERGLFTLMRDYENAKSKYEEVKSKQVNAKIAENLESENKAERFSMLEPPIFPDKPIKPNRKKIIALGIVVGLAGAMALVTLLETLDKRVRGVEAVTALINMRPLVIVPYITTQAELRRKKYLIKYVLTAVVILLLLALAVIHIVVMPLDLLFIKIMARFA
jgi:polysaccharide biosynthesis transport protein